MAGGRARSGAIDDFLAEHADTLLRHATIVSADPDQALDLVQAVAERLLKRWNDLEHVDDLLAYAKRAVTNEFLSTRRRVSKVLTTSRMPDRQADGDLATVIADRHTLLHMLRRLPPRQRACIALRYWMDLSDAQIASELDLKEATVRSLIFRGLKHSRTDLADNGRNTVALPGVDS